MYRPICCISLTLNGVSPCLIAEITLLFGQLKLRKDFWEELNAYYYSNFFRKCFFVVWDFSEAPIDDM